MLLMAFINLVIDLRLWGKRLNVLKSIFELDDFRSLNREAKSNILLSFRFQKFNET